MRRLAIVFLTTLTIGCTTTQPAKTPIQHEADSPTSDDTRRMMEELRAAIAADPSDGVRIYTLAQYLDRTGEVEESLRWLRELDRVGWKRGVNDHDFRNAISAQPRQYRAIVTPLNAREPRVVRGTTAFTLPQRELIPEGIAYDPASGDFFASSIRLRKVVRITSDGKTSDFVKAAQDGLFSTLGMKVDAARGILWVVSTATHEMQDYSESMAGQSGVFAYDLRTGALVTKVLTGSSRDTSLLNDLVVLEDGSVLVTDTDSGSVMRVRFGSDSIETWLPDGTFLFPNGIATIAGEPFVYVADFRGIARVDLRSRSVAPLDTPRGESLGGIDGLASYAGNLIGIQNAFGKPRIIRANLDSAREIVQTVDILEAGNPLFDEPTTCAVAGSDLYYFANPQLRAFDEHYAIWPADKLRDVVILRMPLTS